MKKRILIALLGITLFVFLAGPACRAEAAAETKVDLDLSELSGTVVYAQVFNLMYDCDPWLGKVIRMKGYYSAFEDTENDIVYHACVIPDATACCAQGIEFVWREDHAWPEEYPEEGTDIVVTGRLEIYIEDGYEYLHLVDAELVWEDA